MDEDSAQGPRSGATKDNPDLVAGLGARRGATADELRALLDAALADIGAHPSRLSVLATRESLVDHPGLAALAATLGVPLCGLPDTDLGAAVPNPSARVAVLAGVSSVAESAALAFGPLLCEKRRSANATCAIALRSYDPARMISSAPSTVPASAAGA